MYMNICKSSQWRLHTGIHTQSVSVGIRTSVLYTSDSRTLPLFFTCTNVVGSWFSPPLCIDKECRVITSDADIVTTNGPFASASKVLPETSK